MARFIKAAPPGDGEEITAQVKYHFDCPACGEPHEVESDPAGNLYECDAADCKSRFRVRETR